MLYRFKTDTNIKVNYKGNRTDTVASVCIKHMVEV